LQLKLENHIIKDILYFACGVNRYIFFLMLSLNTFAQSSTTTLYFGYESEIYGINQIHINQSIVNNTQKETLYITEETPFHADSSLLASLSYIQKKETPLKNSIVKTITSEKIIAAKAKNKAQNSKQAQLKYKKNTLPFKAEQFFKNGISLTVSASNTSIVLKNKNILFSQQICNYRINLILTKSVKKTTYTTTFRRSTILKEGIATYKRPPPFLLVYKSTQV
jgi:hypothetical protein